MQPKPGRSTRNGNLAWPALLRKLDRADPSYRTESSSIRQARQPPHDLWAEPACNLIAHIVAKSPMLMSGVRVRSGNP